MAIILEAITHVSHGGRILEPGEIFSVNDELGKKLIKGRSAKVYNSLDKAADNLKSTPTEIPDNELTKAFMALKLDALENLASEKGVELSPEDNTKAKITHKLIEAGVTLDENI